jgi:hypothetical protein
MAAYGRNSSFSKVSTDDRSLREADLDEAKLLVCFG